MPSPGAGGEWRVERLDAVHPGRRVKVLVRAPVLAVGDLLRIDHPDWVAFVHLIRAKRVVNMSVSPWYIH
jgi:hypothetical protein